MICMFVVACDRKGSSAGIRATQCGSDEEHWYSQLIICLQHTCYTGTVGLPSVPPPPPLPYSWLYPSLLPSVPTPLSISPSFPLSPTLTAHPQSQFPTFKCSQNHILSTRGTCTHSTYIHIQNMQLITYTCSLIQAPNEMYHIIIKMPFTNLQLNI